MRDMEWTNAGVEGASRFLNRLHGLSVADATRPLAKPGTEQPKSLDAASTECLKATHQTMASITDDIERFRFNRAVAGLHSLSRLIAKLDGNSAARNWVRRFATETLTLLLAPIAPHLAEEMWANMGHTSLVAMQSWPKADDAWLVQETIEMPIQVNGRLRDTMVLRLDAARADIESMVLKRDKVIKHLHGKQHKKIIIVPNRVVNVIV